MPGGTFKLPENVRNCLGSTSRAALCVGGLLFVVWHRLMLPEALGNRCPPRPERKRRQPRLNHTPPGRTSGLR
eukprot:13522842-Alexandrium_andersonii.AAC.1